jgi:hypothetical protein
VYENGGLRIIDAQGEFPNGDRWRSLGKFGESASYTGVDPTTAKILDKFLDGACLKPSQPRFASQAQTAVSLKFAALGDFVPGRNRWRPILRLKEG